VLAGQDVQAGEVLARRKRGLGKAQEVQAAVAGNILLVQDGELLLQPPPLTMALEAQLPGVIAAVRGAWGADVEGCFGLLRGATGWGSSCKGVLGEDVAVVPEPLTASRLKALAGHGVRAVIAPSWAEQLLHKPRGGIAILLTESLRGREMAPPIAEMLRQHMGRPVALRLGSEPAVAFAAEETAGPQCFGPNSWIRAGDGRAGRLVIVGEAPRFFESGIRAIPAEVDFGDRTEILALDSLDWIA